MSPGYLQMFILFGLLFFKFLDSRHTDTSMKKYSVPHCIPGIYCEFIDVLNYKPYIIMVFI